MKHESSLVTVSDESEVDGLSAPWTMRFTYTRTYGPVVGRFIAGLTEERLLGQRASDGSVFVPPTGYDPRDSSSLHEWVEVASIGTITARAWVASPAEHHPFEHPFGWAQIRLDGASNDLTHFVFGDRGKLGVGERVVARWVAEPKGTLRDLSHFAPLEASDNLDPGRAEASDAAPRPENAKSLPEPVEGTEVPVEIDYQIYAGFAMSDFLRGLERDELVGARAPGSDVVYVPPVGVCPLTLEATTERVLLSPTATLITFIIVHIPVRDKSIPLPYACGDILLDGADTPFLGLIRDVDAENVRRGMRLRAILLPKSERVQGKSAISHFVPTNEPDVDVDALVKERRAKVQDTYQRASRKERLARSENADLSASPQAGGPDDA